MEARQTVLPLLERHDFARIGSQRALVLAYMSAGTWWKLAELAEVTGASEAGVSARIRDLRKPSYGGHTVERRKVAPGRGALNEYRLVMR